MGHGKGRDLPQKRPPFQGKEEQAKDEQDVIKPFRNDVVKT